MFTPEAAGVQHTTVANTTTVDFNALPLGPLGIYVSPIGTYSSGAEIVGPNAFGGANKSDYISVGAQSGTLSYSLTFAGQQTFFGVYWEAGDPENVLDFFQGSTLVGEFTTSQVDAGLGSAYFGNPNTSQDGAEKFVYLDFFSNSSSTNFDSVVFKNLNTSTGFETDNHAILSAVPEPSTVGMLLAGLGGIALASRRRRQRS